MNVKVGPFFPLKEKAKIPKGEIRELCAFFFPVLLMSFSTYFALFIEKLLLGRFSIQAMEISVSANYVCLIFQGPCVALVIMAQAFIGKWQGAEEQKLIGPGTWQFIWFSLLSAIITIPLAWEYGNFYFHGTPIEEHGLPYFHALIGISFLYPLSASLSCFYLGRGLTRLVLFATIGAQLIKIMFAYLLIFGWKEWIPSLGLMGGILSTVCAQGLFCLFLWIAFLSKKNILHYHSHKWFFQPKFFWECIHPGLLRAVNRILNFGSWAAVSYLMTIKGENYLLSLSIGGALFILLPFLGDAVGQAQTIIVSQILGANNPIALTKVLRSGLILSSILVLVVGFPLLIFPSFTFHSLFPQIELSLLSIQKLFIGVWLSFAFFAFGFVFIGYVLAFKDTKFSFWMGFINWINGFGLIYFAIEEIKIEADSFWLVVSLMHLTTALFYWLRVRRLVSKVILQSEASDPAC